MDTLYIKQLKNIEWIKNLEVNLFNEIKECCSIKNFSEGDILCQSTTIPSEIFYIIDGQARLIYKKGNEENTVEKIDKDNWIGLISFIRNDPIENVIAVSNLKVLCIPEKLLVILLKENILLKYENFSLIEVIDILNKKNKFKNDFKDILLKAKRIIKSLKISHDFKKSNKNIYLLASNNIKNKKIYDVLNYSDFKSAFTKYIHTRMIEIEKDIFYKELIINDKKSDNNKSNFVPYSSAYDLSGNNKQIIIKAKGAYEEAIACIKMLCKINEIQYKEESINNLILDKLKTNEDLNLDFLSNILLNYGFMTATTSIRKEDLLKVSENSLIIYKNHISILSKANVKGLQLLSPNFGELNISREEINNCFPQILTILMVKKSIKNNYPKLDITWLKPFFKKYKNLFFKLLIASFVVQLLTLANPLLIQVIIDKVISQRSLNTLQIIGTALFIITLSESILRSLRTFLLVDTTNRIDLELGSEVITHLFRLPLNFFSKRRTGELSTKINELEKIREFFTGQTLTTIIDALFSIIYIFIMLAYSWLLTLISLSVLPVQVLITLLGVPLFKNQYRKVAESNAVTQNHLIESINGIQTIKTQSIENITYKSWYRNYIKYIQKVFKKTITATVLSESSNLLQKISQIMVLWIGASMVLRGELSLGQLIAFRIISGYVTQPILRLSGLSQRFQELKVSFERLGDVLNSESEIGFKDKDNINIPKIKGEIFFQNIDFYYESNEIKILDNININIKSNSFTGIVGKSGSGKSTFVKLLARLYIPSKGKIKVDDFDIQKVDLYSFRKQIGFVSQEPYLISGSIIDNISIAKPEASDKEIIDAAKKACAHDFIMDLKDGYKTSIQERGDSLSGGQRQRIAIARALLSNPRILILDEATSALDYFTEKKVLENIKKLTDNTTIVFVTHRFPNLVDADRILFLKNGQLIEHGTHQELINNKSLYYAMSQNINNN